MNYSSAGIAVADILLELEYFPFLFYRHYSPDDLCDEERFSWGRAAFHLFHAHFSIVIHNVSIWLTLSVAIWRHIMIKHHSLAPVYCTMHRCHLLLLAAYSKYRLYL